MAKPYQTMRASAPIVKSGTLEENKNLIQEFGSIVNKCEVIIHICWLEVNGLPIILVDSKG